MDRTVAPDRSSPRFSLVIFGAAAVLAVAAAWLLAPALAGSIVWTGVATFSATTDPCRAARLAVARGDLWAACADAFDGTSSEPAGQAALAETVSWAPSRSGAWLGIAAGGEGRRATEALRMSFYTGPAELDVIARRLSVALRPGMLADTDMERLVRHDVFTILTHAPDLKPAIVAAYRQASPEGKRFLVAAVEEIEAGFVADLRLRDIAPPSNRQ